MTDTTPNAASAVTEQLTTKPAFDSAVPPSEGLTSGMLHQLMFAQTDGEVRDICELYVGAPA